MSEGTPMLYRFSLRGMCAMALTQRLFWDAEIKCLQPLRMCSYFIFFFVKDCLDCGHRNQPNNKGLYNYPSLKYIPIPLTQIPPQQDGWGPTPFSRRPHMQTQ